jgi:hypothetical protein
VQVSLLDSGSEEPRSKLLRYTISGIVLMLLIASAIWYLLRFQNEKHTVERFLNALIAGDTQQAYRLWKPSASYSYSDFQQDWGPDGYYGPVKSYRIDTAVQPRAGSGVVVAVRVSPFQPFPADADAEKSRRTKEVKIWVERGDQSLSFPP